MVEAVGRHSPLIAGIALIQETFRVSFDLNDLIILDAYQKSAAAMIHSRTVGLDPSGFFRHI